MSDQLSSSITKHTSARAKEPSEADLLRAIADALAMGQVENILIFLRSEPWRIAWAGRLLDDERLAVRLGLAVLFEHLAELGPEWMSPALSGLAEQLGNPLDHVRGDAAGLLISIGSPEALALLRPLLRDPSPEIAEMVRDALQP